jgi:hypothetical protein
MVRAAKTDPDRAAERVDVGRVYDRVATIYDLYTAPMGPQY